MPHRILVVDDEPDLETLITQRFRKRIRAEEMTFSFASDGADALHKLESGAAADVVLSDINMPVMDGLTLLSKLHDAHPLIRSVIVSAYGDMPNIRTALNRGAFDFVTKPIDFQDLEITLDRAIQEALHQRQAAENRENLLKLGQEIFQREAERSALKKYLPPQVANLLLDSSGATQLQGVLQPITVMYADIRGFTAMSEDMDAREIVSLLNEFFTDMSAVILECNGTLDKFIGDCIMALFGAPVRTENAAQEGLDAAIRMQLEMGRLNQSRASRNLPTFSIGIGLHCGLAVVGNIGSVDRVQYTAIGDTVNVASRLVNFAGASQIIVSSDILASVPNFKGFEHLGEVELKGRNSKMNIFSAQWAENAVP